MSNSPIDSMLYGEAPKQELPNHIQEFNSMVHAALSTPKGMELREHLENYLKKPVWSMGEPTEHAMYREGARRFVMDLLNAYIKGKDSK